MLAFLTRLMLALRGHFSSRARLVAFQTFVRTNEESKIGGTA